MEKDLLREIIRDFENVSTVVNARLKQLYRLLGEKPKRVEHEQVEPTRGMARSSVKETIEQQRREMMGQVEEMRRQAMAQVQESISSTRGMATGAGGMPGMGMGMPGMGMGMPGPNGPMSPDEIEKLRGQLQKKMEEEQKTAEDVSEKETEKDDSN